MTEAHNADSQAGMTPLSAAETLRAGNARFRDSQLMQQVEQTADGQFPFAVVLSCIDSRASAELIFDQGIGDIFSIRIAGNLVNEDVLGSMEFACKVMGSKLIVVLGHTGCGAIRGACDGIELGNLTGLLAKLDPAVAATTEPRDPAFRTGDNPDFVNAVAWQNVLITIDAIRERSPVLRELLDDSSVGIVGGLYDVRTGVVELTEP